MVKTNVEVITPAVAAEYLKANRENQRPLNKGQVAYYARMMSEGQWQLNGEAVVFDINGKLTNGQHRCAACVEANVPFETVVVRDVPEDSFYTFDTGQNRRKAQIFGIAGIPNATTISSAINKYLAMKHHNVTSLDAATVGGANNRGSRRSSTQDMLAVYDQDSEWWQSLIRLVSAMYNRCRLLQKASIGGIIAHLVKTCGYDMSFVVDFFEQLFYEERTELAIIRTMRNRLINDAMSAIRMTLQMRTQLLIKCWECYKAGKDPKILRWQKGVEPEQTFK